MKCVDFCVCMHVCLCLYAVAAALPHSLPKGGGSVCNLAVGRAAENNYVHEVATEMRQSPHAIMERTVDTWALSRSGIV